MVSDPHFRKIKLTIVKDHFTLHFNCMFCRNVHWDSVGPYICSASLLGSAKFAI